MNEMQRKEESKMLVVYSGLSEQFVCTLEKEHKLLQDCFNPETGRDVDDFDREVVASDMVQIETTPCKINDVR